MFDNEKSSQKDIRSCGGIRISTYSGQKMCVWVHLIVQFSSTQKVEIDIFEKFWRFFSFHCKTYLNRTFSLRFFSSLCVNNVEKCWSFTYFNCDIRAAGIVTDEATFDGLYDEWMMWGQWEWNFKVYIGYCVISMR